MSSSAKLQLGFIGTGTITEAIVTGLVSGDGPMPEIFVSPRSAKTAARLADMSPQVTVAPDNQGVVDAADMVFLAVRPNVAQDVVRALRFRPQRAADGVQNRGLDPTFVPESNLRLRRMDIHVYGVRLHGEEQHADRIASMRHR